MHYRLLAGTGELLEEGEGSVEMAGGALVLSPVTGDVIRVPPADIAEVSEPEPYAVRLLLTEGPALDLLRLGAMRTQLLAELADARASGVTRTLLLDGVGDPEVFPAAVDDVEAELRLYDDALVVLPVRGDAEKVPYPFIREVTTDPSGYRVSVRVAGRGPIELGRLARRTTEFIDQLRERSRATAGRTSAFLAALLPGLGPLALRATAALLRDGVAGSRTDLDAIDPTAWPALTEAATRPERVECLRTIEALGPVWIGFKQVRSVQRPAQGVQPWHDPAITPARLLFGFDAPFHSMGAMLAYSMLGTGNSFGNYHPILPRANVTRGRLTPAGADLDALTVSGDRPTVLAFALGQTAGGTLIYEALNDPEEATHVFRATGREGLAAVNRSLDLVGFRVAAAQEERGPAAHRLPALRLLREAHVGRVDHSDAWADQLDRLL